MRPRLYCSPAQPRLPIPSRRSLVLPPPRRCQWALTPSRHHYHHHHCLYRHQIRHLWQSSSLGGIRKPSVAIDPDGEEADWTLPTIYALATPPGKSAVAIVRISGPASLDIYSSLTTPPSSLPPLAPPSPQAPPKPRYALLRTLYHPTTGEVLDPGALCLFFPRPSSLTGEDVVELQLHGGPAIIRAVLAAIPLCDRRSWQGNGKHEVRYAEPGEFTRRAFHNERLGLTEIEALGETLDATTEEQRRRAVRGCTTTATSDGSRNSSGSAVAQRYEEWRASLILARGELEALIDFAEDQSFDQPDANAQLVRSVARQVEQLRSRLRVVAENAVRGELLRDGISLSLVGAPNAGKSSLLNRVVGREVAIVSPEAGTTRDVVELAVDVGGFMVVLGDTAGLRVDHVGRNTDSSSSSSNHVGAVEEEGIRRARQRAMTGHVVVAVIDMERGHDGHVGLRISQELAALVSEAEEAGKEVVVVVNKLDLLHPPSPSPLPPPPSLPMELMSHLGFAFPSVKEDRIFGVSCIAGGSDGIQPFLNGLTTIFRQMTSPLTAGPGTAESMHESIGATYRQRLLVEACLSHLDGFLEMAAHEGRQMGADEVDVVAMAEELRGAADRLGRITGRGEGSSDVEEVLGAVFEKFCVGK